MATKRMALVTAVVIASLLPVSCISLRETKQALTLLELSEGRRGHTRRADKWMCIRSATWDAMTGRQREAVEERLHESGMVLYMDRDDIPEENVVRSEHDGKWIGYRDGSVNGWTITFQIPCCFYARFGNVTGNLGAYGSEGLFIWVFCRWVKVWSGLTVMA